MFVQETMKKKTMIVVKELQRSTAEVGVLIDRRNFDHAMQKSGLDGEAA